RREVVLESIQKQGKLTDELKEKILVVETMSGLEDLYLPYKPKRRTRATVAKEKGLEPLAQLIFEQKDGVNPEQEAVAFVNEELKVLSTEEALAGARDIIAEWVNEEAETRAKMRDLFFTKGVFISKVIKGKEDSGIKFKDYFDLTEPVSEAPSHRILAMRRGEKEEVLTMRVLPPEEEALAIVRSKFVKGDNLCTAQVLLAVDDSYKRLLSLSIESEVRMLTKQKADEQAIEVFAKNLRQLLMEAALGEKRVLAIDPGFRTGCKVVYLDAQGKLIENTAIYISQSDAQGELAAQTVRNWCSKYNVEAVAIGNGTASRETESFIRGLNLPKEIMIIMVNESGASIYSASEVARAEFPSHDVTVRGAVSIGRRLQDPLAELVKIDPKSIGVGQYQHDVDQGKLKNGLDDIVISCVNQVGVELNTASKQLLMYVSGLGPALAQAIVEYRNQHGAFKTREELKFIPRLSAKVFEQAAGFLRIRDAVNPLDSSAVHPEQYELVEKIVKDANCSLKDIMSNESIRKKIDVHKYVTGAVGLPTLLDIIQELAKPGRDPRAQFEVVEFKEGIHSIDQLTTGMKLNGIVTNITNFGCFVDIGVHHDGLIHISEMSDKFVKNPADIVHVHQKVSVTVMEVDLPRQRIALSMRTNPNFGSKATGGGGVQKKEAGFKGKKETKAPEPPAVKRKSLYPSF
ncbi:MAG: RNA-binding transcriptional accessory protein, partial [Candidatus Omnitrophica bacterium]|nr:RNA-binding transcriptional accessory protein [Candidatus Omnitrophota bacterium]